MRAAIIAALLLLTVGCGSSDQPEAAPSSSAKSSSAASTTTVTTTSLSASRDVWEREVRAASPRTKCQGADAFNPECVVAMEKFATTIERLAKTVASSGGRYVKAGLKALEVRDAAREWNDSCVTQPPEVRSQRGCLVVLFTANNGDDAIIAEVYAAEATR